MNYFRLLEAVAGALAIIFAFLHCGSFKQCFNFFYQLHKEVEKCDSEDSGEGDSEGFDFEEGSRFIIKENGDFEYVQEADNN